MKILITLFLLLLTLPGYAQARMNVGVVGGGVAAAGCDTATQEVGNRTQESTSEDVVVGYAYLFRRQADCTGTLQNAYLYSSTTAGSLAKICIYSSSAATPQTGDAKIGCSAEIANASSTGLKSGSVGAGSVTAGNYYWVMMFVNPVSGNWPGARNSTASMYYKDWSANYASPLSTLGTEWVEVASYAPFTAYVQIQ